MSSVKKIALECFWKLGRYLMWVVVADVANNLPWTLTISPHTSWADLAKQVKVCGVFFFIPAQCCGRMSFVHMALPQDFFGMDKEVVLLFAGNDMCSSTASVADMNPSCE
jgi:hypothetical protein